MKPRTKEEEKIVRWTNKHGNITPKQMAYAKKHCFSENILESRGTCLCTACKHTWHVDNCQDYEMTCPHCGKSLKVVHHSRKGVRTAYFSVVTTQSNMQVIKWFLATRTVSKTEDEIKLNHVGSEWIRKDGKYRSVELERFTMTYRKDSWCFGNPMELRRNSLFARYLTATATYYVKVLPILKRNGWKRNGVFEGDDGVLMHNLLSNKAFESWYKIGHYGVCADWLRRMCNYSRGFSYAPVMSEDELTLIKLANRRHVVFKTSDMWKDYTDYLSDLQYMQQDIHNPSILFPKNFQEAHQRLSERVRAKRDRENERAARDGQRQNMLRLSRAPEKQRWLTKYAACFSDMTLTQGNFTIKPLITTDDFSKEAAHMHHCIMSYYGTPNTLLLSIERDGKKCETAEVNLLGTGEIIQCRGVNNCYTDYHQDILNILKDCMKEFIRRINKPIVQPTLPVPMSFYKPFQIAI